jgi:hypothetical protein
MKLAASRRWPALLAALAAISMAFALAACSGSDSKKAPVDTWVKDLCSAAALYNKAQDKASSSIGAVSDTTDAKTSKKAFQDAISAIAKGGDDFRSAFDKIGEPDTKSGKAIHDAFVAEFDANKKQTDDIRKKVDALDTNSKTFEADLTKIFDGIPESDFRAKLAKVADSQDVADAIDANSDCAGVIFSNSSSSAAESPTKAPTKAQPTPKPGASKNEKWVFGICVATQGYADDLQALANGIDLSKVSGTQKLKELMVKFLTDAQSRTKKLKSDIDKLGDPDGKDGKNIQKDMSAAAAKAVTIFDKAVKDTQQLDGNDASKLASGLSTLGQNLSDAGDEISNAFSAIDTKWDTAELTKVMESTPACDGLGR